MSNVPSGTGHRSPSDEGRRTQSPVDVTADATARFIAKWAPNSERQSEFIADLRHLSEIWMLNAERVFFAALAQSQSPEAPSSPVREGAK